MIRRPTVEIQDGDRGIYLWRGPHAPHRICLTRDCERCEPKASARPLLTWALVIFLAGVAFGALLSSSSRGDNSGVTSAFESSAAVVIAEGGRDGAVVRISTTSRAAAAAVKGEQAPPRVVEAR